MNTSISTAILSLAVAGLAGCAGMQQKAEAAYVAPQRAPSVMDKDQVYMATVERIARRRGIEVVWVNVPRKPLARRED